MIKHIWLYPPLALARVGSSPTPCENFYWGPDDLTPAGTGRTRIMGAETLEVADDGTITSRPPGARVIFKDKEGFRPICPFFELHAAWEDKGRRRSGPVTRELLRRFDLSEEELKWQVTIANLKAFHFTGTPGDRIEASVEIPGTSYKCLALNGSSPNVGEPLVPPGQSISFGKVQATQPTKKFPEFRLRFTPPHGKVYAPTNIADRLNKLQQPQTANEDFATAVKELVGGTAPATVLNNFLLSINEVWQGFTLPAAQCLLNPQADWPNHNLIGANELLGSLPGFLAQFSDLEALSGRGDRSELIRAFLGPFADVHNLPPSVFAFAAEPPNYVASLGIVDDMADGTVSVELGELKAMSRIVIAPPSFAPDRRLPVSIADGLMDRMNRKQVRNPNWVSGSKQNTADAEVRDLLDRAYETVGLQNVDAVADFFRQENQHRAMRRGSSRTPEEAADLLWDSSKLMSVETLPLTELAIERHRRNTTGIFFENFARDTRDWFDRRMRIPAGPEHLYDKRMPGLMRGLDRYPLHLTRRQYEFLRAWSKRMRRP